MVNSNVGTQSRKHGHVQCTLISISKKGTGNKHWKRSAVEAFIWRGLICQASCPSLRQKMMICDEMDDTDPV